MTREPWTASQRERARLCSEPGCRRAVATGRGWAFHAYCNRHEKALLAAAFGLPMFGLDPLPGSVTPLAAGQGAKPA